ncbi:hypothetical protein B0H13DRAFT_1897682 [Mycena leptocephala]|nr:hypothetical protein B0H13DRAFT_1897682 [Mycena leptocephala]
MTPPFSSSGRTTRCMHSTDSFDVNTTIGAFQIGVLIAYALFGVTTTQTYIYYSRFPDDSSKLKALVAFVWVCEMAHVLCLGHTLYVYTISDYAHPERMFGTPPKSFITTIVILDVLGACVQGFFSFRIYAFSKKLYIPVLSWVMSVLRVLGCTALFIMALDMESLGGYLVQWEMARHLHLECQHCERFDDHGNAGGPPPTAALVEKLILWSTAHSQCHISFLTSPSEISITTLACLLAMKQNFIWVALFAAGARVPSNSLLASLNSRATLRAMNEISLSSLNLPSDGMQMGKVAQIGYSAEPSQGQLRRDKISPEDI